MAIPDTPLFVKTHDFNVWLLKHTLRFPKPLRMSYTGPLETLALEFEETLALANTLRGTDRQQVLAVADAKLLALRLRLRSDPSVPSNTGHRKALSDRAVTGSIHSILCSGPTSPGCHTRTWPPLGNFPCPHLVAWLAHSQQVNTRALRRDLWRDLIFQRDSRGQS